MFCILFCCLKHVITCKICNFFVQKNLSSFVGKTSTIVALVRLLVKMNLSVLLTSYTHSAVDNILLKLKQHADFVRIGPQYRIQPEILEYSFENLTKDFSTKDQFSTFMKDKVSLFIEFIPLFRRFLLWYLHSASKIYLDVMEQSFSN